MEQLPNFTYHPDPVATGAIRQSDAECPACGRVRGYAYALIPSAIEEYEGICPWCIADGSAHEKFDVTFADDRPLRQAGLPEAVVTEVTERTPGYESWQQEEWLSCCGDACEYHGDAPVDEIHSLDADEFLHLVPAPEFGIGDAPGFLSDYAPGGSPAFYKFVCRHCRAVQYGWDCD